MTTDVANAGPGADSRPRWVMLPSEITPARLQSLGSIVRGDLRSFFGAGGLRFRTRSGRVAIAADDQQLLYAEPLQSRTGALRHDRIRRLVGAPIADLSSVRERLRAKTIDANVWPRVQAALLGTDDLAGFLQQLMDDFAKAGASLALWRLGARSTLLNRRLAWRFLRLLADGMSPKEIRETRAYRPGVRAAGLLEATPALAISGPMVARGQPLAAVLQTVSGHQIVAMLHQGAFVRPMNFHRWPVGVSGVSLRGSVGPWRRREDLPANHAEAVLTMYAIAADQLIRHLTNPTVWTSDDGTVDFVEQEIAWSSVIQGLSAVTEVGGEFSSSEAPRTGFRAIGILQGLWEGPTFSRLGLATLLDPQKLAKFAVALIPNEFERLWAEDLLVAYRGRIKAAFPTLQTGRALKKLVQVRNLVHGMGAGTGARRQRLEVFQSLGEVDLSIIGDLAVLWWSSVLLAPETHCRSGRAPWETSSA
jgi:hypothetical protein